MRGVAWMIHVSAVLCLSVGCGDTQPTPRGNANRSASEPTDSGTAVTAITAAVRSESPVNQPDQVVSRFYQALRSGDNGSIESLLTDRAREETAKSGLAIQSQTSSSLEYQIGETDYINETLDGAHVMSLWAEPSEDGNLVSTEVIWVLRKQPNGWKISGMATAIADGQLPLLFDFENPEDMLQKKSYVESQLANSGEEAAPVDTNAEMESAHVVEAAEAPTATRPSVAEIQGGASIGALR